MADQYTDVPIESPKIAAQDYSIPGSTTTVLLRYRGIWSQGILYNINDLVRYAGNGSLQLLLCIKPHVAAATWNNANWAVLVDFSTIAQGQDFAAILDAVGGAINAKNAAAASATASQASAQASASSASQAGTAAGTAVAAAGSATASAATAVSAQAAAAIILSEVMAAATLAAAFETYTFTTVGTTTTFSGEDIFGNELTLRENNVVYVYDNGVLVLPSRVDVNIDTSIVTVTPGIATGHDVVLHIGIGQDQLRPVGATVKTIKDLQPLFNGTDYQFELRYADTEVLFSPSKADDLLLFIAGVPLEGGLHYQVAGSTITFSFIPRPVDNFYGRHIVASNIPAEVGGAVLRPESFGAAGDRIRDDSNELEIALGLPLVSLDGNYRITRRISRDMQAGQRLLVQGKGVIYCDGPNAGINFTAAPLFTALVSTVSETTLDLGGAANANVILCELPTAPPAGCKVGQPVKLVSADQLDGCATGSCSGMCSFVVAVSGNNVYLAGDLNNDVYTNGVVLVGFDTTIRLALNSISFEDNSAAGVSEGWNKTQVAVRGCYAPVVSTQHKTWFGQALVIAGCFQEQVFATTGADGVETATPVRSGDLITIVGGSTGGRYIGPNGGLCRYVLTSAAVDVSSVIDTYAYHGRTRGWKVVGGVALAASFASGEDAVGYQFDNCEALAGADRGAGAAGFLLRGIRGKLSDVAVEGFAVGAQLLANSDDKVGQLEIDGLSYYGAGVPIRARPDSTLPGRLIARRISVYGKALTCAELENVNCQLELNPVISPLTGKMEIVKLFAALGAVKLVWLEGDVDWDGYAGAGTDHVLISYTGAGHKIKVPMLRLHGDAVWDTPVHSTEVTPGVITLALKLQAQVAPTRSTAQAISDDDLDGTVTYDLDDLWDV